MDDVRRSVLAKAEEVGELRAQTLRTTTTSSWPPGDASASLDGGGRLLALGNGGSATDAMDVADFAGRRTRAGGRGGRSTSRRTRRS